MEPIRLGMVGGGQDSFIGAVHRIAARLDGGFALVAGALSSTPERARDSGRALGLDPARSYASFAEMAQAESARPDGIRAVAIVTPNHLHADAAIAFLQRGIHVICDKPLAATPDQAARLAAAVRASPALFVLTHTYSGYPMVREARAIIARGDLGRLRVVQVEYAQDWLTEAVDSKQAAWRTDPARSGPGGSTGDIGSHAHHLACFVSGQRVAELAADLHSFVPGRVLDDNAHVLLRFDGGARGMLWCSQVAPGNANALRLRVYGERGGLDWAQERPDDLVVTLHGEPSRTLRRRGPGTAQAARVPAGHPEGYLEAFATIYADAARAIRAAEAGQAPDLTLLPGLEAGVDGMRFITACTRSSAANASWVALDPGDASNGR